MNEIKEIFNTILDITDVDASENFSNLADDEKENLFKTIEYLKKLNIKLIESENRISNREKNKIKEEILSCRLTLENINNIHCIESYYRAIEITLDILTESIKMTALTLLSGNTGAILSVDILKIIKKIYTTY